MRMAIMSASVPELWNRTFSALGISSLTQLAHSISQLGRTGEVRAPDHLILDSFDDLRSGVAENERAVTREVVEDAVAVHVVLRRALGVGVVELERVLTPGVVGHAVRKD